MLVVVAACGGVTGPAGDPRGVPDVARVICEDGDTRVPVPAVRPQRDGVHILVENRTGEDMGISYRQGTLGAGDNADRGLNEVVWPIAPGRADLLCTGNREIPEDGWTSVEVVDPEGLWVSPELDCGLGGLVAGQGGGSYAEPPTGDRRNPVEIAREFFAPLREGDVVEPAGYPKAQHRLVRLVRDGETIAVAEYVDASFAGGAPRSGWIQNGYQACEGVFG